MFIRTTDKTTGQLMLVNMDHIESIVAAGTEEDPWTELRIHGQNDSCYRVLEGIESIEGLMKLEEDKPAEQEAEWAVFNDVDRKGRPTGKKRLRCTNCHESELLEFGRRPPKYCSSCGRKMKGVSGDEHPILHTKGSDHTYEPETQGR